ncbi:hypothetical protein HYH02_011766 [Chlamydomonas schloesseri]|uniref:Chitin-binding type-2 domain-containing protein n=1 Tax=Chlamydomonas schloesseri TaxID=2026947 RepID=A0A835TDS7_9CHLO|nr:hypothetical protein HYH02_011766 [Chlamydomonas schloesseri]|eukprot:KAG2436055.1 hypothetical protein HYH02_011766 [Chlamydomonas schloesseri]
MRAPKRLSCRCRRLLSSTVLLVAILAPGCVASINGGVGSLDAHVAIAGSLPRGVALFKPSADDAGELLGAAPRRSAQELLQVVAAVNAIVSNVPKVLSKTPRAPSAFSADFGLFMNAAGDDGKFYITGSTNGGTWRADVISAIGKVVPWLDVMDSAPAATEAGWLFRATVAVTNTSLDMSLSTASPYTVLGALADTLGISGLGIKPVKDAASAATVFSIAIATNRTDGSIRRFAFAMGGSTSLSALLAKLGLSVSNAATGITLGNPSLSVDVATDSSPTTVQIGLSVSGIPFLPGSSFDGVLIVQGSTMISIQITGNVRLFDGTCTATAFSLSVGTAAKQLSAGLTLTCPDAGINGATASLTYDAGAINIVAESVFSYLDGSLTINRITFSSGQNATYIAASASGGIASYIASVNYNVSRIPVNGKRPLNLQFTLPEANVGAVVRAIGPTADDLLPDFVKNAVLPSFFFETYSLTTGSGNRPNTTSLYHVTVGPQSSTGIAADFLFDKQGVLTASLTMAKSLDLGAAVTAALPGVSLPFDVRGILVITQPYVSVVAARAPRLGVVSADSRTGTVMGFGLQVPAILGSATVNAAMLLMDANKTRVTTFELGWTGDFTPVQYVTLRGALLRIQSGTGVTVMANGTLVSVDVAVVLQLTGGRNFTLSAEARNIKAGSILKTLFPATPDLILTIISPLQLEYIAFTWNGRFSCEASPNLSSVPGLSDLLKFLSFKQEDIKLRPKLLGNLEIELAIVKSWELNLGSPFVGKSLLQFALSISQSGANTQFAAGADFSAQLRLPFLDPAVIWFNLGATVAYDSLAPPPSVSFSIRAAVSATTNPFSIVGFPWIKIAYIGGEVGLTPMSAFPFVSIYRIAFEARGVVLNATVGVAMLWDQPKADFGIQFSLQNLNLQSMLNQMSISATLGPFNVEVRNAQFSFARQDITMPSGSVIPAGLRIQADITFLTIFFNFNLVVDTTGFDVNAQVANVTNSPVIIQAFKTAQDILDALNINVKIRDQVKIDMVRIGLTLRTSKVSFSFGIKAYLFGLTLDFDITLDPSKAPYDQVFKTLADKFVEPLTAACTKDSYIRGSGFVDRCSTGRERQGDFCYNNCPTDWQYGSYGKLNVCYQNCPPNYRDDGIDGTGLTCSAVMCNPGQIWDGALLCWNACNSGYSYKATRCYKDCPDGWNDDAVGLSCVRNSCGNDDDNGAGMCYPNCRDGYRSNGLTMCIERDCPDGYRNDPLSCWRDVHIYGKGCCCVKIFGHKSCCGCRSGYSDDGCTCRRNADLKWKDTYDRGAGYPKYKTFIKDSYMNSASSAVRSFAKKTQWRDAYPMVCGPDKDYDGAAICYDKCRSGYTGAAFMCWGGCPSGQGLIDCGSYCAPRAAGSCANFVGATYQNCKNKYPQRRMVLDMVLSGNYTKEQIRAAAAGDHTVFKGSAWDPKSVEITHYTSLTSVNGDGFLAAAEDSAASPGVAGAHAARLLQSTAPGAGCKATDTAPQCWCVGKAYGVYPDPAGKNNRYVICAADTGILQTCPGTQVFSATLKLCTSAANAAAPSPPPANPNQKPPLPAKTCKGRDDGIYFQDSRDNTTAYKCEGGDIVLDFCPDDYVLDESTGECKIPDYKPPGELAPCQDPDCFCADKKKGNYTDVLRGNIRRYISCRGNKGRWRKCDKGNVFNTATRTCGFLPPNATTPIKGCKDVDCFCVGRADGVYVNPWSNQTGINCNYQMPSIIPCSDGFDFVINKQPYCQPKDPLTGAPGLPPGVAAYPPTPPDAPETEAGGDRRRNRRRGV